MDKEAFFYNLGYQMVKEAEGKIPLKSLAALLGATGLGMLLSSGADPDLIKDKPIRSILAGAALGGMAPAMAKAVGTKELLASPLVAASAGMMLGLGTTPVIKGVKALVKKEKPSLAYKLMKALED